MDLINTERTNADLYRAYNFTYKNQVTRLPGQGRTVNGEIPSTTRDGDEFTASSLRHFKNFQKTPEVQGFTSGNACFGKHIKTPQEQYFGDKILAGRTRFKYKGNRLWDVYQPARDRYNIFGQDSHYQDTFIPRSYVDQEEMNSTEMTFSNIQNILNNPHELDDYLRQRGLSATEIENSRSDPSLLNSFFNTKQIRPNYVNPLTGQSYGNKTFLNLPEAPNPVWTPSLKDTLNGDGTDGAPQEPEAENLVDPKSKRLNQGGVIRPLHGGFSAEVPQPILGVNENKRNVGELGYDAPDNLVHAKTHTVDKVIVKTDNKLYAVNGRSDEGEVLYENYAAALDVVNACAKLIDLGRKSFGLNDENYPVVEYEKLKKVVYELEKQTQTDGLATLAQREDYYGSLVAIDPSIIEKNKANMLDLKEYIVEPLTNKRLELMDRQKAFALVQARGGIPDETEVLDTETELKDIDNLLKICQDISKTSESSAQKLLNAKEKMETQTNVKETYSFLGKPQNTENGGAPIAAFEYELGQQIGKGLTPEQRQKIIKAQKKTESEVGKLHGKEAGKLAGRLSVTKNVVGLQNAQNEIERQEETIATSQYIHHPQTTTQKEKERKILEDSQNKRHPGREESTKVTLRIPKGS